MNMSYCRFQNTALDLKDCLNHLFDEDLSEEEQRARKRIIEMCIDIIDETEEEMEDYE